MSSTRFILSVIGAALLLAAGPAAADTGTIKILARIVLDLNHQPSEEDKAVLAAIVDSDDSSEEAATIAMALSNMQHQVTGADAERLADIVDDDLSDAPARKLAAILLDITGGPSDGDKVILAALAE